MLSYRVSEDPSALDSHRVLVDLQGVLVQQDVLEKRKMHVLNLLSLIRVQWHVLQIFLQPIVSLGNPKLYMFSKEKAYCR